MFSKPQNQSELLILVQTPQCSNQYSWLDCYNYLQSFIGNKITKSSGPFKEKEDRMKPKKLYL